MSKKNWIAGAINPANRGALRKAAKAAGMSTQAYAKRHAGDSGVAGRRSRLALTLTKLRSKKRGG